jgi:hypothetical protein
VERDRRDATLHLLRELAPQLDRVRPPALPDALVERTLQAARQELRRSPAARSAPVPVAAGFAGELARLLGAALPALLLAAAWNLAVLVLGARLLQAWLPPALAEALLTAYGVGAAGWLALALGSVPLLAHRRALGRMGENEA